MRSLFHMLFAGSMLAYFPLTGAFPPGGPSSVTSYGNDQGSPTVTTNIVPGSGSVSDLVDGVTGSGGFTFASPLDRLKWIRFTFSVPKIIDAMRWFADVSNDHDDWIVAATNDSITWVELATINLSGVPGGTEFTWTNPNAFTSYILWQKVGSLPSTVPISREVQWKIATGSSYSPPTNVPSYAWKYGFLDRTSFITITSTSGTGGGTLSNLVDGAAVDNSTDSWWFSGGQTGREFVFDFGTAVKLAEMTVMQDNSTSQGTWQPAWSNDGVSFTNFGSPVTIGGAVNSIQDLSAMPAAHRYVRLLQVTGTTSSSPFQREWLFKGSMT